MATDLRELLAVLRILHEIELTAGLMRNVARATRRLYPRELPPRVRGILERMGAQASVQTHLAVDAFADNDAAVASALPDMDDVMDDLQKEMFRAIFAVGAPDESALQMAVQLAFVGRDYERAADHAVMIGRWVEFMVTGELPGADSRQPALTRLRTAASQPSLLQRRSPAVQPTAGFGSPVVLTLSPLVRSGPRGRIAVQGTTLPKGATPC